MKKIIIVTAIAMGAGLSGVAVAAPTGTLTSQNISVTKVLCPMLEDTVKLGVSTNVHGAYMCDETDNVIRVAACHEGGSRQTAVTCAEIDPDGVALSGDEYFNGVGCDAAAVAAGDKATEPSYNAYGASSAGGAMSGLPLGGRCDATTTLTAITFWD